MLRFKTRRRGNAHEASSISPVPPDEESVTEYITFGEFWREGATFLRDVRRLPRMLPDLTARVVPRQPHRVVARFWELLLQAVELTCAQHSEIAIAMSGGIDSAALAVASVEVFGRSNVRAVTMGYAGDFEDPEPAGAVLIGRTLGIDVEVVDGARSRIRAATDWIHTDAYPAEPVYESDLRWDAALRGADILLWGLGGDSLLRGQLDHYARLARTGKVAAVVRDALKAVVVHGRRPGFGLRALRRTAPEFARPTEVLATSPGLSELVSLRRRSWSRWPSANRELCSPVWLYNVDYAASLNRLRPGPPNGYPFFNVALARYATSLPTVPWAIDKEVLRAALRGRLPDEVRLRPKAPLAGTPRVILTHDDAHALRTALNNGAGERWFDPSSVAAAVQTGTTPYDEVATLIRCASAARWLARIV